MDKILDFLHEQGWNYGMVPYLDTVTGKEVHQIDAHQGERCDIGRGNTWKEAARDLVKKIYYTPGAILH